MNERCQFVSVQVTAIILEEDTVLVQLSVNLERFFSSSDIILPQNYDML